MKKVTVALLILFTVILFKTSTGTAQSLTMRWDTGLNDAEKSVKDFLGSELPLGATIMVIQATAPNVSLDPVLGNPFFLGAGEQIIGGFDDISNPAQYVPVQFLSGWNNNNLDLPANGTQLSLYLRVFDNVHFQNSFDVNGNFLGNASLIDENKYGSGILSYYFDTPIETLTVDSSNFTLQYNFNISGMQTNIPLTTAEAVPEPSAMMLAGFGFIYLLRKIKRK